jgi:hypothetical protein
MCARSDQPEPRDQTIARLAAEALKARSSSGQACPDTELVAAYADQGLGSGPGKGPLGNDERLQLEVHFAGCARCQKILAVLGVGLEAAASQPVVAMPAPAPQPVAERPSPQRWLWWVSPAFGAAAAALLWMALRPASPGGVAAVQTAADYSGAAAAQQQARTLSAPAASSPVEPSPAAPRRDVQALGRLSQTEPAAIQGGVFDQTGGAIVGAKVAITDVARGVTRDLTTDDAGQYVAPALNAGTYTVRAEASGFSAQERESVVVEVGQNARVDLELRPGQQTQTVAVTEAVPALQARATTALGAAPAPQALADLPLSGRNFAQLLSPYSFASPDGGALWRLGAAGHIERSTDRGQTWQPQSSGVTVDLLAGSASSNEVAWVVGRAGAILRTIDGQQWQRIAPPAGVTGDWVTVVVRSATSATVVSPIRRFSTEDGGITWTERQ